MPDDGDVVLPQGFSPEPHQDRYRRMMDAVSSDKTGFLGVVIAAAYVEYYLRDALQQRLPEPERFLKTSDGRDVHYDVSDMLKLVYSFDVLDEARYKLFKQFAELRNQFAHGVDEYIYKPEQKERLRKLYVAWVPEPANVEYRESVLQNFNHLHGAALFEAFTYIVGVLTSYAFGVHVDAGRPVNASLFRLALREAEGAGRADRARLEDDQGDAAT